MYEIKLRVSPIQDDSIPIGTTPSKEHEVLIGISISSGFSLISSIRIYPSIRSEGLSGGVCGKWKDGYDPSK